MKSYSKLLGALLIKKQWTLATAESITGGGIGNYLVKIPGASRYYKGGIIAYDNEIKQNLLCVSTKILNSEGAVSPSCAIEMAKGLQKLFRTEIALSITGIAGPGGATPTKPIGLVFISYLIPGDIICREYHFKGSRLKIISDCILTSLKDLNNILSLR